MKYMGSKNRHAKFILPHILKNRKEGQYYVEPFVGGANIIDKVAGNRIGSDINFYLIELLKKMQEGVDWVPTKVEEYQYKLCKDNKDKYPAWSVGYCGFCLSYAGKWFGGWCRDAEGKRNYVMEAYNNTIKQAPFLNGIEFYNCKYNELEIPKNSIIYCDPPYKNTTKYKDDFDHDLFWNWVRIKHNEGHSIFVSEYEAPDDFIILWEREISSSLDLNTGNKKAKERLFSLK